MCHHVADPAIGADAGHTARPIRPTARSVARRFLGFAAPTLTVAMSMAHGLAIWIGLGGYAGLTNGWPLWRDDHPLYFHSALVTRAFLADSHTTAGYDPSF